MVRDNIHPTTYRDKLMSVAIAKRILGLLAPKPTRAASFVQLTPTVFCSHAFCGSQQLHLSTKL